MLFHKSRKKDQKTFDRTIMVPVVRASICTGERVAGFQNISTGKFDEVTLIRIEVINSYTRPHIWDNIPSF